MNATPLNLDNLEPVAAKDMAIQNAALSAISGRVYSIAQQQIMFGIGNAASSAALDIALQFNGQNMVLGLSEAFANALLQAEGVSLTEVNEDILNLLVRLKVIPKLPQGVQFKGLALGDIGKLDQNFAALPKQLTLRGATQSGELLNWDVTIATLPQTSLATFLKGFDFLVSAMIPSPLLTAKVPMPIVAAKTDIPANQLRDIAVGDVILFS